MQKLISLPHLHTSTEVAALLQADSGVIDRLVRCGCHPPWVWKPRWKEPRWDSSTIPEWRRILDTIDLATLPKDPPPLQRPSEVFKKNRMGPTKAELATAARMCGVKRHQNEKTPPMGVSPSISCKQLLHLDEK